MSVSTSSVSGIRNALASSRSTPGFYQFNAPPQTGAPFSKKPIYWSSEATTAVDGDLLRFTIDRRGYLDLSSLHLNFTMGAISPNNGGAIWSNPITDYGSWNFIDKITVSCGSKQLKQIQFYGYLQNQIHTLDGDLIMKVPNTEGGLNCNWNSRQYNLLTNSWRFNGAAAACDFAIPINIPAITNRILPMKWMPDKIVIEIQLNKSVAFTTVYGENTGAMAIYPPILSYTNIKLVGDIVSVTSDYDRLISAAMGSKGGISWGYTDWQLSTRTIQQTTEIIPITDRLGSINNIIVVHAPYLFNRTLQKWFTSSRTGNTHNMSWCWPDCGLLDYQWKIDGENTPTDPVTVYDPAKFSSTTDQLWNSNVPGWFNSNPGVVNYMPIWNQKHIQHFSKQLGLFSSQNVTKRSVGYTPYNGISWCAPPDFVRANNTLGTTTFSILQNFESFGNNALLDGLDTSKVDTQIQLILRYNSSFTAPVPILIMIQHDAFINLTKTDVQIVI